MKEVKIKREDLLQKVRENRIAHKADLCELREEMVKDITAYHYRQLEFLKAEDMENVDTHFNFPIPEDHTEDYEQVITMLEMSVDDEIVLDHHEFQQYVMDNWAWKGEHLRNMAFYSKST